MKTRKDPCTKMVQKMYLMLEGGESSFCDILRAHLDVCERCATMYSGLKDLVGLCQRFPGVEMPEEQRRRVKARLLDVLGGGGR